MLGLNADQGHGLVVDLFAGGGGASLGLSWALGRDPDIAINHDPIAIAIHQANHPNTVHYCQDVWAVEPIHATQGRPVDILWASPDCKHFSKAKGGKPKCQNIRDLAWVVIKWARQVRPRLIMLENVEEFTTWGPLGPDKRPIEAMKGKTFRTWRRQLQELGYRVQHRELRACDYGAPTIRKRLFLVARRDDLPIVWPEPTHGPGRMHPWLTAAECIDWNLPTPSIFERERPLAANTLKRIAKGIDRFVVNSPRPFIVGVGGREGQSPPAGVDRPMRTMTAKADKAVAVPFVTSYYGATSENRVRGQDVQLPLATQTAEKKHALAVPFLAGAGGPVYGGKPRPADQPLGTLLAENHQALVSACLVPRYGERPGQEPRCRSVEAPLATVVPTGNQGSLATCVLKHYGGVVGQSPDKPLGTVTGIDHHSVCTAHILRQFGRSVGSPADAPVGAVMPGGGGKTHVVSSHLVKLYGTCEHGAETGEPMPTVTAGGNHVGEVRCGLVTKYYGQGIAHPVDEPLGTATSRDRFSLAEVRFLAVQDHAAEVRELLIRFRPRPAGFYLDDWDGVCSDAWAGEVVIGGYVCRIVDIGLRMFEPRELFRAQGFPDGYIINPPYRGRPLPKKYQTKACGNSVSPVMAKVLGAANANWFDEETLPEMFPLLAAMAQAAGRVAG